MSPEAVSRYEVLTEIATGGMATVFVGRTRGAVGFSRLVALKRPHPFVMADPSLRKNLEHEARVASMIHHTHVVSVLDVELVGKEMLMVLDYVEGGTLAELQKHVRASNTAMPARVALRIVLDIASGLHAAHVLADASGTPLAIVHRDVSPQNILVGLDGVARLTDFGIAKIASDHEHTATNVLKGKLAYLAPEYVERRAFDTRSDEYALGVVAWEALAGTRLFRGANEIETLRLITDRGPLPLSETAPALAAFDGVLARAMARFPNERYDTVADFAAALESEGARSGIASHAEVAKLVEEAVGETVRARRRTVESLPAVAATPLPRARDAMPTMSLPNAPLETETPPSKPLARRALIASAVIVVAVAGVFGIRAWARDARPAPPSPSVAAISEDQPSTSTITSTSTSTSSSTSSITSTTATSGHPVRARPRATATASTLPKRAPPNPYE